MGQSPTSLPYKLQFRVKKGIGMRYRYFVKGMVCAACVAHVERAVRKCGFSDVSVNLLTGTVVFDSSLSENEVRETLARALRAAGYDLLVDRKQQDTDGEYRKNKKKLTVSLVLSALLMAVAMGHMVGIPEGEGRFYPILMALLQLALTVPVVVLNFKYFRGGFSALFALSPNMDSLIALGAGASLLYSFYGVGAILLGVSPMAHLHDLYFDSAAMILTLVSLGKLLESRAKKHTGDAMRSLSELIPKEATVLVGNERIKKPVSDLLVGDLVVICAGEAIPVDGEVVDGFGSADEANLTGESMPVDKGVGASVFASTLLRDGFLTVRVTKMSEDSSIRRILTLLENASAGKAKISRFADKVAAVFVPVVMGISLVTFAVWMIATGNFGAAIRPAVSVLVISCPCALGLATPTAITVGTGLGATRGILIRNAAALERMGLVKYVVFDKTGTVTFGKPEVRETEAVDGSLLAAAYSLERNSSHPLAHAICLYAEEKGTSPLEVEDFTSEVGRGVCGRIGGLEYYVGKREYLTENGFSVDNTASGTQVLVGERSSGRVGVFHLSDRIKPDSRAAMEALLSRGITPVMLTGDNESAAAEVAERVGISEYRASLLPSDKERMLSEYKKKGVTAMVGDGVNDAPALMAADIGVAVGAGTEVAIDSADVILTKNTVGEVISAIDISRATLRVIKQNLFWALLYNSIGIPVAAGVLYPALGLVLNPMLGAAAMSLSSVCVVSNSLRLRRLKLNQKQTKKEKKQMDKRFEILVEGMMCMHCAARVRGVLEGLGAKDVEILLDEKKAVFTAPESFDRAAAVGAITAAGYKAE